VIRGGSGREAPVVVFHVGGGDVVRPDCFHATQMKAPFGWIAIPRAWVGATSTCSEYAAGRQRETRRCGFTTV